MSFGQMCGKNSFAYRLILGCYWVKLDVFLYNEIWMTAIWKLAL